MPDALSQACRAPGGDVGGDRVACIKARQPMVARAVPWKAVADLRLRLGVRANGYEVNDRGRVRKEIREAFEAAN